MQRNNFSTGEQKGKKSSFSVPLKNYSFRIFSLSSFSLLLHYPLELRIYYIHHIRGDLSFRVKRRRLLSGSLHMQIWFEMITCKVDTEQVTAFPRAERLPTRTIFSDMNFRYDEDFWKDFNVIPLEEELSKLIERISLKIEEIGP